VEFQAQARNMQEHFDLLHQAIVSVRTSMSTSRVTSPNSMDIQSRCINDHPYPRHRVTAALFCRFSSIDVSALMPINYTWCGQRRFACTRNTKSFIRPRFAHLFVEKFEKEGAAFFRNGIGVINSSSHSLSLAQLDDRLQQPTRCAVFAHISIMY
jgi:hypothetical protein